MKNADLAAGSESLGGESGQQSPASRVDAAARRIKPRQVFWFSFVLMFVVTAVWSVGLPLMGNLDEPSHTVKAAAVASGELGADETNYGPGRGVVELPYLFYLMTESANCIGFWSESSAQCQPALTGDLSAPTEAYTTAARYNPLYYAIVGSPSIFGSSAVTIYLMRLMSCLLASLLLALMFRTISEIARSHWIMLGAVVCITPTMVNLSGAINPQTTELAGALLVWVTLLAILKDPKPNLLIRRMARLTIGTVLFVNARGLGPVYLALILAVVLLVSPWREVVAVVKNRRTWPFIVICGLATIAAYLWIRIAGSLGNTDQVLFPDRTGIDIIKYTINSTSYYIEGTLASFAWGPVDTPSPLWLVFLIAGVLSFVILAGFALARFWEKLVMLGVGLAVLVIPIYAHYSEARYIDIFWQGRYILPLAFGVPVLAGFAMLGPSRDIPVWINRRIMMCVLLAVGVAQTVALAWTVHRFVNGLSGRWFGLTPYSWLPPVNPIFLVLVAALAWLLLAAVLVYSIDHGSETGPIATGPLIAAPTTIDQPPVGQQEIISIGEPFTTPSVSLTK